MKILVIMGSPRKGESYAVVRKVEEHIQPLGEVEFDYLWLKDVNYGQCIGCHVCIKRGEEKCPLRDDSPLVAQRIADADGIILATPVYCQSVSYLMKIMFDRFAYLWHRPRFFDKLVMGVASGGGQFKGTLGYIAENVKAWGCTYVTGLGVPHLESLQPAEKAKTEANIKKQAERFYTAVREHQVRKPGLSDLLWFRMWRINSEVCKEAIPADYAYWKEKGWHSKDYYTDQPLNVFQVGFSRGMGKIMRFFMSKIFVGY